MPTSNVDPISLDHNLSFTGTYDPSNSNANPPSYHSAVLEYPNSLLHTFVLPLSITSQLSSKEQSRLTTSRMTVQNLSQSFPSPRTESEDHQNTITPPLPTNGLLDSQTRSGRVFGADASSTLTHTRSNHAQFGMGATSYGVTSMISREPPTVSQSTINFLWMHCRFSNMEWPFPSGIQIPKNHRYLIDHCVHQDDRSAYLKVICYDHSQYWYDACSYRPPCILVVPLSFCNVRFHPNVAPITTSTMSRTRISRFTCDWRRFFFGIHKSFSQL